MNTGVLKKFAQAARRQLREQVAGRLEQVLRTDSVELRERGSALRELREQIAQTSKKAVIDRVAYTWFNRFCALRFMDVNRYTRMGVVSPAEGLSQPEILQEAKRGYIDEDLKGFVEAKAIFDLLNGQRPSADPQQEAYRLLLVGVCNSYNAAMPFLFEKIADYTELLMPLDLLSDHAVLHDLRQTLTPDACQDVEVIGWLYQYYISERKDEVFEALKQNQKIEAGDIPAATQLFTPHWIVRYLVENSLGRLWMLNHPNSNLVQRMEYYIAPAQVETDFLKVSSPEDIRLNDPACGSGHMLTYAFDLLYFAYEESGYPAADIPRLILEKNLYGIEIDPRAGALAAFALTMKARAKDRRFLSRAVQPNICVLENVSFTQQELDEYMRAVGRDLFTAPLLETLKQFEQADNFGSLIRPVLTDAAFVRGLLEGKNLGGDLFLYGVHERVLKVLKQAEYLAPRYHMVVANPPYMGSKGMNSDMKEFAENCYPDTKSDTYSMFVERLMDEVMKGGFIGLMTPFTWMHIKTYQALRINILNRSTLISLIKPEYHAFFESAFVPICCFTLFTVSQKDYEGTFIDLSDFYGADLQSVKAIEAIRDPICGWSYQASANDFAKIPGNPIVFSISNDLRKVFEIGTPLENLASPRKGLSTGKNEEFLRYWFEVNIKDFSVFKGNTWFPMTKGGGFRKWYGNNIDVIIWKNNGEVVKNYGGSVIRNEQYYLKPGGSWNYISLTTFGIRYVPDGFINNAAGPIIYTDDKLEFIICLLNSAVAKRIFGILSPTMTFEVGTVGSFPVIISQQESVPVELEKFVGLQKQDWDMFEISWNFEKHPLFSYTFNNKKMTDAYLATRKDWQSMIDRIQHYEQENNSHFIKIYGLQDELTPEVPLEEITLTCNPRYRYGGKKNEEELEALLKADTMKEFISYAVGCMFGRYSLEKPGLVLANQGETLPDYLRQVPEPSFLPDEDNAIPVLEGEWFSDDMPSRFKQFLRVAFGDEHYAEILAFIEDAIGRDIRSYFVKEFYKDHVQMYKKRPIYWMFSSPKGSFNVLMYMHRYKPDTISIILNNYLRQYREKLNAHRSYQEAIGRNPTASQSEKTKALRETDWVNKNLAELKEYEDETLYPLAAQQIKIDLDDGVKVNYGKFGKALKPISGL